MKKVLNFFVIIFIFVQNAQAAECNIPEEWQSLCKILQMRVKQKSSKMKLKEEDVIKFQEFLNLAKDNLDELKDLKNILPKTTIELLMAIRFRNVTFSNAELIAQYLNSFVTSCKFANNGAFDENTSHIIGRKWDEIDYSGENISWQEQQKKYRTYGITDFKTLDNIERFFKVEAKLPYFFKTYRPKACKNIQ